MKKHLIYVVSLKMLIEYFKVLKLIVVLIYLHIKNCNKKKIAQVLINFSINLGTLKKTEL